MPTSIDSPDLPHVGAAVLELAGGYADRGASPRDVWVVVTTSYRVSVDPTTDDGRRRSAAVEAGDVAGAVAGLDPAHTEVGFRYALDAKSPA